MRETPTVYEAILTALGLHHLSGVITDKPSPIQTQIGSTENGPVDFAATSIDADDFIDEVRKESSNIYRDAMTGKPMKVRCFVSIGSDHLNKSYKRRSTQPMLQDFNSHD
jgi:hypothetical protein